MKHTLGFFGLIRIQNCLIAFSAVIVGGFLQTSVPEYADLFLFAIVAALICGSGNALNDILDIESDRINHPIRPLPSGLLTIRQASIIAVVFASGGMIISLFLAPPLQLITLVVSALLVWYNVSLKKTPLYGNLLIAFLGALTVLSGGVASGESIALLPGSAFPALMAFMLHFAREVIKDVQDLHGDQAAGGRTFPIISGARPALRLAAVILALIVVVSLAPLYLGWYGSWYTVLVIVGVDFPLLAALVRLRNELTARLLSNASRALKLAMIVGLIAVTAERLPVLVLITLCELRIACY
ncbi:MAG: geranylgeranylglycerol-phosphate geranylgeranyltransferase [candidate division Zixibacteria bacterium]|nr:geranylgeranylglycerol-phosphate geranylgeranyltransferase [candidate division Zixibacteria bacterium]